jgi:hypothetical protein
LAEQKLIANGFRIKFGPKLSNAQKSKYLMIVDSITSRKFRKLVRGGSEKGVSLAV